MSSDWQEIGVLDVFDVRNGLTKKREEFGFGEPFVAFKDVFNNYFIPSELESLANTSDKEQRKYSIKKGDVLITRTSENFKELGMTSVALKDYPGATYNGFTKRLRPKKEFGLNPEYLGFFFRSPFFRRQILSLTTMTTRASLNNEMLARLKIRIPSPEEQNKIAEVLGSCHEKIHLNQQTNKTLEAMAQAIFKSWFVDFDPVRTKIEATSAGRDPNRAAMAAIAGISLDQAWDEVESALNRKLEHMSDAQCTQLRQTAELFPDELVEREIGEVPKGWEVVELKKVIKNFDRKRVPLSRREREERPGEYPYYGATSIMDYVDDYLFEGRNVLMAEDGSVMDDNGKPVLQYVDGKIWVNNHAHVLSGKGPITNEVLYLFLKTVNISPYVTGAVQKKINQRNMNSIPFLLADKKLYEFIYPIIKGFFDKIIQNEKENEELENLIDTLLPKLISGDIELNDKIKENLNE